MGAAQRLKGARFEREVATALRVIAPETRRGLQPQGGEVAPDVDAPGLWIECKRGRRPSPRAALAQARADARPGRVPVAVIRDDREPAFAVLAFNDFIEFYSAWLNGAEAL